MITNKDMIPELLAGHSQILKEEIEYLEKSGNFGKTFDFLIELRSLLLTLCNRTDINTVIYNLIDLDDTNNLIIKAKALCSALSMQPNTYHPKNANLLNPYTGMCENILNILNQFERLRKAECDQLQIESRKLFLSRIPPVKDKVTQKGVSAWLDFPNKLFRC